MEPCRLVASNLACRRGDRLLFSALSLELAAGQALHVRGANGTGKTSLIRILAGLLRAFEGSVEHQGGMALLDQNLALDEHQPLGRALAFWQALDGDTGAHLHRLGLAGLLEVPVRYLSTGQRKRAAMARLLGQRAQIWLLDEPLNGLDTQAVALVEEMLAEHCRAGGIALVASHQDFTLPGDLQLDIAEYAA